ncbi:MFS transporter [Caenispirillum bisanense]|uniref:Predicted arabinose efflux permease, MFS family n=1 Tax=Caenispirillum bisanense TaxID=414052 RepID=A0A286GYJ5_9PROT|nr:MFS transporter [Caenispirillum bisanense]SOE00561.1 Predicted arabinose efflux permease, MFS family [Caenispirillum bisanense]
MSTAPPSSAPAVRNAVLVVIVAACMVGLLNFGVRAGFGLFLEPMSAANGWGREVFATAIAVQNLLWGAGQPFAGAIADRFGTARVLVAGGFLYAAGTMLMAVSTTPTAITLTGGLIVGMGLAGSSFAIALAAMARVVPEEKRSWALGLGTATGSLGQFLLVPLGQGFISAYGWQTALVLMGSLALLIAVLAPALKGKPAKPAAGGFDQSIGEAVREAFAHRGYVLLFFGFFVCGFHVAFIQTHLPAYIVDKGLSPALGAWALGLVGLFNVIGAYSAGLLAGRYSKKYLLSIIYVTRAVVIAAFVLLPISTASVLVFSAAIGLLWLSTVPPTSGLVAQIFGPRYMATLFGIVFFGHQIGAFLGVWMGGVLYDATGSYDIVWWSGVALGIVAALLHWPIDERKLVRLPAAAAE